MAEIVFYLFASLLLLSALVVVFAKNPVHSIMALIFAFVNATCLLIMTGVEFLPFILIIVYVGAVVVLFLFVVITIPKDDQPKGFQWFFLPVFLIFGVAFLQGLLRHSIFKGTVEGDFSAKALGHLLYSDYFLQFHLGGLILLTALIGIIIIAQRKDKDQVKKQSLWKQLLVNPKDRILLIKDKK